MTQPLQQGDLVVQVGKDGSTLRFLTLQPPPAQGMLSLVLEVQDSSGEASKSVEHRIGEAVLAFLSANSSSSGFGLERYREVGKEFARSLKIDVANDPNLDEADRDFQTTLLILDDFDDSWTVRRLDEIEDSLKRAATQGSDSAVTYLSDRWPKKRAVLEKRLTRK
jgi:hypothetical protein